PVVHVRVPLAQDQVVALLEAPTCVVADGVGDFARVDAVEVTGPSLQIMGGHLESSFLRLRTNLRPTPASSAAMYILCPSLSRASTFSRLACQCAFQSYLTALTALTFFTGVGAAISMVVNRCPALHSRRREAPRVART